MSFLGKIVGLLIPGGKGAGDVAKTVAETVEHYVPSATARHEMSLDDRKQEDVAVTAARAYDPRTTATRAIAEFLNVVVDCVSRIVRPGITITLFGGVVGWWDLPATGSIDPWIESACEVTLTFWFGIRTVVRDVPTAIAAIRAAVKK